MSDPLVTVVIPTHHRASLLKRALQSVVAQTYPNMEIVVISDGTDPETAKVVQEADRSAIRFVDLPTQRGASAARNVGLGLARGEWVAFLDDDDAWVPQKLEAQWAVAEKASDTNLVYCRYSMISDLGDAELTPWLPSPDILSPEDFLHNTAFNCSVPLIRRQTMRDVGGFDEAMPGCQDKDLWVRLIERGPFAMTERMLVRHHIHHGSMTTSIDLKIDAREKVMEKHAKLLDRNPKIESSLLERLGLMYLAAGRKQAGVTRLRRAAECTGARPVLTKALRAAHLPGPLMRAYVRRTFFRRIDGVTLYY